MTTNKARKAILACGTAIAIATATPAFAQQRNFDLPAQSATRSIPEFGRQAGVQIIAPGSLLRSVRTPALKGTYDVRAALGQLLEGSGLRIVADDGATITLGSSVGNGSTAAKTAAPIGTTQNPPSSLGGGSAAGAGVEDESAQQSAIVVTGTHISGRVPVGSSITTFTRRDIETTGVATVEQFARDIPENFSSVDASNVSVAAGGLIQTGGNQYGGSSFNLSGLGPSATLTLLNGHRIAPAGLDGAFVDISLVPLNAVDHIDILNDGASAIYGADAVAGVVNLVLRKDYDGALSSIRYGSSTSGGDSEVTASQLVGTSWQGGGLLASYQYDWQSGLLASDRNFVPNQGGTYYLSPRQHTNSIFASAHQQIGPDFSVSLDGLYSNRDFRLGNVLFGFIQTNNTGSVREVGGNGELDYRPGGDWHVSLVASTFETKQSGLSSIPRFGQTVDEAVNLRSSSGTINASGSLLSLPAGNLRVAFGSEVRSDSLHNNSQVCISTSCPAPTLQQLSRHAFSAYGELSLPLIGPQNAIAGFQSLDLSFALRFDHYNDFGSTTNPKVGLDWRPFAGLSLRGTYGTSFHPPFLTQLINTSGFETLRVPNPASSTGTTDTLINVSPGNPGLQAETARSFTIGATLEPRFLSGLRLDGTFYSINFSGRVSRPPVTSLLAIYGNPALISFFNLAPSTSLVESIFSSNAVSDFAGGGPTAVGAIFDDRLQNISKSLERGITGSLRYDLATGVGNLSFLAFLAKTFKNELVVSPGTPAVSIIDDVGQPASTRVRASLSWASNGWSVTAAENVTGSYRNTLFTPAQHVSAWYTSDAQVSYEFRARHSALRGLKLVLTATNIFDAKPPHVNYPASQPSNLAYDAANANAFGRIVSLQLQKAW